MACFLVRRKVCIAPIYVWTKDCKFAPHQEGSNADFAQHMKGSHADFTLHMERRHSFGDQQIAKIAISAIFFFFQTTYILGFYKIYVTTFEYKCVLRETADMENVTSKPSAAQVVSFGSCNFFSQKIRIFLLRMAKILSSMLYQDVRGKIILDWVTFLSYVTLPSHGNFFQTDVVYPAWVWLPNLGKVTQPE